MISRRLNVHYRFMLFSLPLTRPLPASRAIRHQAFEAAYNQEDLSEARTWRKTFDLGRLPKGNTTYSRSSGPGGQHVNKSVCLNRTLAGQ
jgi:hypothetical protein